MKQCPRCKRQSLTEVDESEIFHVSRNRMHVNRSIRKGHRCLRCGYENCSFGIKVNEKKDTDKKKGKS